MSDLTIRTEVHSRGFENLLKAAGARAPVGIARALNRAGAPTETAYLRSIKKELGLASHPYAKRPVGNVIKRRTSRRKATQSRLTYSLAGFGKGFEAIYYKPKEALPGASINWLGTRKRIAQSFYLAGRFPRRRKSRISHAVWRRTGKGKWALDRPRGPGVPDAMSQSATRVVWERQASARIGPAMTAALTAILRGY